MAWKDKCLIWGTFVANFGCKLWTPIQEADCKTNIVKIGATKYVYSINIGGLGAFILFYHEKYQKIPFSKTKIKKCQNAKAFFRNKFHSSAKMLQDIETK